MLENIILETRNVSKYFGGLKAVDGVSLQVQAGSLHSIIGPNGAGKTTFFNLLSGTLKPTSGQVFFRGRDITHVPMHRMVHLGLGRSFQITNIFPNLTVLELSLIHISEPTRLLSISYAVFCLKKKLT